MKLNFSPEETALIERIQADVSDLTVRLINSTQSQPYKRIHRFVIDTVEKPLLMTALECTDLGHNQSQAANTLGINRATLNNRIKRFDLL